MLIFRSPVITRSPVSNAFGYRADCGRGLRLTTFSSVQSRINNKEMEAWSGKIWTKDELDAWINIRLDE